MYRAELTIFAIIKRAPIAPPNSGPKVLDIIKYAPPPSTAPFVEIAQIEKTVKVKIPYAIKNCPRVSKRPALPTMNPTRRKSRALNMDSATGQKTPANTPSVRVDMSPFEEDAVEAPNSEYPDVSGLLMIPFNPPRLLNNFLCSKGALSSLRRLVVGGVLLVSTVVSTMEIRVVSPGLSFILVFVNGMEFSLPIYTRLSGMLKNTDSNRVL